MSVFRICFSKRFQSLTGQESFSLASELSASFSDLEAVKQEILVEIRKEIHLAKKEIIDGIILTLKWKWIFDFVVEFDLLYMSSIFLQCRYLQFLWPDVRQNAFGLDARNVQEFGRLIEAFDVDAKLVIVMLHLCWTHCKC